jgi:flagellar motor component MotA
VEGIIEKLDQINKTLEKMVNAMKTPKNKFQTMLEYCGAGVGILGIVGTVDIIKTWMFGG